MQMKLYDAWEVRVPFGDDESFKQAKDRVMDHAESMGIKARLRRGKGRRFETTRYHFWEVPTERDAMLLYLAYGDVVRPQKYPMYVL